MSDFTETDKTIIEGIVEDILIKGDFTKTWNKNVYDTTQHGINKNKSYPRVLGDVAFEKKSNDPTFTWYIYNGNNKGIDQWQQLSPGLQGEKGEKGDKGEDSHVAGPAVELKIQPTQILYADKAPTVVAGNVNYDTLHNTAFQQITFSLPQSYDYQIDNTNIQMLTTDDAPEIKTSNLKKTESDENTNAKWTQDLTFKIPASMNKLSEHPSVTTIAADQQASVTIGAPTSITSINNNKTSQSIDFKIPRGRQAKLNIKDTISLNANENPLVELSTIPVNKGIYSEQDLTFKIPKPYDYQLKTKNLNAISMVDTDQSPTIIIDNKQGGGSQSPNITQDLSITIPASKTILKTGTTQVLKPGQPIKVEVTEPGTSYGNNHNITDQLLNIDIPAGPAAKLNKQNTEVIFADKSPDVTITNPILDNKFEWSNQDITFKLPKAYNYQLHTKKINMVGTTEAPSFIINNLATTPSTTTDNAIINQEISFNLPTSENKISTNPTVNTLAANKNATVVIESPVSDVYDAVKNPNTNKTTQSISFGVPRGRAAKLIPETGKTWYKVVHANNDPSINISDPLEDNPNDIYSKQSILFTLPKPYDYKLKWKEESIKMIATDSNPTINIEYAKDPNTQEEIKWKEVDDNAQIQQYISFKIPASKNELALGSNINPETGQSTGTIISATLPGSEPTVNLTNPVAINSKNNNKTKQAINFTIPAGPAARLNIQSTKSLYADQNPQVNISNPALNPEDLAWSDQDITFKLPKPYDYYIDQTNIEMGPVNSDPEINLTNWRTIHSTENTNAKMTQDMSLKLPSSVNSLLVKPTISTISTNPPSVIIDNWQQVPNHNNQTTQDITFSLPKPYKYKLNKGALTSLKYNATPEITLNTTSNTVDNTETYLNQTLNLKIPASLNKLILGTTTILDDPTANPAVHLSDISSPSGVNNNETSQTLSFDLPRGRFGTINQTTAEINNSEGLPNVTVQTSGPEGHPSLHFKFKNINGRTPSFEIVNGELIASFNTYE